MKVVLKISGDFEKLRKTDLMLLCIRRQNRNFGQQKSKNNLVVLHCLHQLFTSFQYQPYHHTLNHIYTHYDIKRLERENERNKIK